MVNCLLEHRFFRLIRLNYAWDNPGAPLDAMKHPQNKRPSAQKTLVWTLHFGELEIYDRAARASG